MGFCKPMSEEVPLINTKTISKEELDAQRENAAKVQAVLQSRYTDKPLACVITYGCQQNVADSEHIKGMLADMGYAFTDDRHKAQFILFNTCAVREHAEDRVFGNVGALKSYKAEHPDTVIALCGCMMQQQHIAERIKQSFPFVDLVFGTHVVHRLPELLLRTLTRKKRVFELPDMDGGAGRSAAGVAAHYVRLQQLLHLLHRAVCAGAGALSTSVRCAGRGQAADRRRV